MAIKPDRYFWLSNGKPIKDLKQLSRELTSIDDTVFSHHVNDQKNDFYNWIKDILKSDELSEKIKDIKSAEGIKDEIDNYLKVFINKKSSKKDVKKIRKEKDSIKNKKEANKSSKSRKINKISNSSKKSNNKDKPQEKINTEKSDKKDKGQKSSKKEKVRVSHKRSNLNFGKDVKEAIKKLENSLLHIDKNERDEEEDNKEDKRYKEKENGDEKKQVQETREETMIENREIKDKQNKRSNDGFFKFLFGVFVGLVIAFIIIRWL